MLILFWQNSIQQRHFFLNKQIFSRRIKPFFKEHFTINYNRLLKRCFAHW